MPTSAKGNEMFYQDEAGNRGDEKLHWPILDGVDPEHEAEQARRHMLEAIAGGMDPALAALLWG